MVLKIQKVKIYKDRFLINHYSELLYRNGLVRNDIVVFAVVVFINLYYLLLFLPPYLASVRV